MSREKSTSDVAVSANAEPNAGVYAPAGVGYNRETGEIYGLDLSSLQTWDEAIAAVEAIGGEDATALAESFGDGCIPVDKASLVNVPFMVLEASQSEGKFGLMFVVRGITRSGVKFRFTDGSSGIRQQLDMIEAKRGKLMGLICQRGLNVSEYTVEINGENVQAKTFYINM